MLFRSLRLTRQGPQARHQSPLVSNRLRLLRISRRTQCDQQAGNLLLWWGLQASQRRQRSSCHRGCRCRQMPPKLRPQRCRRQAVQQHRQVVRQDQPERSRPRLRPAMQLSGQPAPPQVVVGLPRRRGAVSLEHSQLKATAAGRVWRRGNGYQPRTYEKISGATIVASDSTMNFGVLMPSLPHVIFSFGTAPE